MSVTLIPSAVLPSVPSLEYYRKQAKALLNDLAAADPRTVSRVTAHLPASSSKPFSLADAQWVLAREHGFPSWPKFKKHVEEAALRAIAPDPVLDEPEPGPARAEPPVSAQTAKARARGIGTDAVFAGTGRHWDEWFAILNGEGCASMNHTQIAAVVRAYGAGAWWAQMVAVEYERARGLRDTNMSCSGDYNVGVSRTLGATVATVFEAWTDAAQRERWLPDAAMTVRRAAPSKRLLINWSEGGSVCVDFSAKASMRCQCVVEHSKLTSSEDVERRRALWSAALDRLRAVVEG